MMKDKRLMQLAGLLKENEEVFNPFEENTLEDQIEAFIKQKVQDDVQLVDQYIGDLKAESYNIYNVESSRGMLECSAVGKNLSKEQVLAEAANILSEQWGYIREYVDEELEGGTVDAEEYLGMMEAGGEFIGVAEGVDSYSGFPALDIGISEETFLAIVNSNDQEEAEEEYGLWEDEQEED